MELKKPLSERNDKKPNPVGCLGLIVIIGIFAWFLRSGFGCNNDNDTITETEAYTTAQEYVRAALKSPASADFPLSDFKYIKNRDSSYTIMSYVDAQNSFGAMLRSNWRVRLKYKGGDWLNQSNWKLFDIYILNIDSKF